MIGFPVELVLGRLTPLQAATGLGTQAIWLAISLLLVRIVWRAGIRIYQSHNSDVKVIDQSFNNRLHTNDGKACESGSHPQTFA